jgi:hypothetical protein
MHRTLRLLLAGVAATVMVAAGLPAAADPGEDHSHESHSGPPELPPFTGPSSENMTLKGNADKDGVVNSDLAFWGDLAFAGNYDGFRVLDISNPNNPRVLSDYFCRGPQNDVSVYRAGRRLILFQSIDRAQTKEDCDGTRAGSSTDTPLITTGPDAGRAAFGFEGIRMFDVTDPRNPRFLDAMPTACGSHTHTLIPEPRKQRLHLYVSSYPLGSGVTPSSFTGSGPRCESPHQKISVVTVPFRDVRDWTVREKALSDDTGVYPGTVPGDPLNPPFKACHDIQVLMKRNIAVGSCAGDTQIWDVSDPADPTTGNGERHTHVRSPSAQDQFEFMHSAVITWDGKYFATMDETGGGGTPECDGPAEEKGGQSESGFYYFYKLVKPGDPAPPLLSRYMIPRPQGAQICVSHNANVVPLKHRYVMVAAYYQGGNSIVDFTDPRNPTEIAYSDPEDTVIGAADSWSTYWYNDYVYANGGLNRRGATANRGLDVFLVTGDGGRPLRARQWHHSNPQTQEVSQGTG